MGKKNFYAVITGRKTGIFTSWEQTREQVHGFPGAQYKGFGTKKEAETWMKTSAGTISRENSHIAEIQIRNDSDTINEVVIYTDGGALNNPGPGGYGIVQIHNGKRRELSGGYRLTTNNRMELMACIVALRELEFKNKPVTLFSDSSYVVNGVNKGWAENWRKRGWIKSDNKPALNPDLWEELLELIKNLDITFRWLRGHAGNPLNERCDELAVASARKKGLPEDPGYRPGIRS